MQRSTRIGRARALAGATLAIALGTGFGAHAQSTLATANVRAIPTYESVGLYWSSPGSSNGCSVQFRASGTTAWTKGLDMWFDSRDNECRGSLVNLTPNTSYEVQMGPVGGAMTNTVSFKTWSNTVPVAKTVTVSGGAGTLNITSGGTASGYVVYDGGGATLDAANAQQFNVTINASYVVLRNLKLTGAMQDAIRISPNVTDVIVEDNDISNWGRTMGNGLAADMDSGVRAICTQPTLERVTIQRNKIHDPRYPANSWSTSHPAGAQGVTFSYCGGNHVIRHNEIYSTNGNHYNDGIGGEDNFSASGFPNADSDIYGNIISQTWDDGIEAEGGNENVRVWGNYIDQTGTGVASTVVSIGPMYIWRNVWNRNQFLGANGLDQDDRQNMMKAGSDSTFGHGRRYIFHNTMLQPTQSGYTYPLGGGYGVGGAGIGIWNTISKNNIWNTWKSNTAYYETQTDSSAERDMYNGSQGDMKIANGINAAPQYAAGNGNGAGASGLYQLAAGTPGYDQAVAIPNFNDNYMGNGPDVGAAEAGAPAMKFGVAASPGSAVSGATGNTSTSNTGSTGGSGTGSTGGTSAGGSTGTSTSGAIALSSSALTFTPTGLTQTVTFTNTTTSKVTFMQATMSSTKYMQTNNCGDVAPGASCTATITYYPTYGGSDTGTLTVTSTAPNSPSVISLAYSSGTSTAGGSTGTGGTTTGNKGKKRVVGQ